MPNTLVHGFLPYLISGMFTKNEKLKLIAFAGGVFPDLDGIFILFNTDLYYKLHHELLHPPFIGLLISIPIAIILSKYTKIKKRQIFLAFFGGFLIHSITDVFFTNWYVKLLWPIIQTEFSYPIFANLTANTILAAVIIIPGILLAYLSNRKKILTFLSSF